MAKSKRKIAKTAAVTKNIEAAVAALAVAVEAGNHAVSKRAQDHKSLSTAAKRLSKKSAVLTKRKRLSAKRAKSAPSGETRKALRAVLSELAKTKVQLTKARAAKDENATELASLKGAQRRANAYAKAITQADKSLGKDKPAAE